MKVKIDTLHLLIDTSSKNCSVALSAEGEVLGCVEASAENYIHAEKLHPFIDELLQQTGKQYSHLSAVVVSKGPGSFTGLRIGVSAAKGFCLALSIPLMAIETTSQLADYGIRKYPNHDLIVPMIDARRMEVYTAVYGNKRNLVDATSAKIVDAEFFQSYIDKKVLFIGDGADKATPWIQDGFSIESVLPSATMLSAPAFEKWKQQEFENLAYFEPFYLKDFIPGIAKKTML